MKIEIAPLRINDAWQLPEIIKNHLRADIFDLTIFSCPGYSKYVEVLLAMPAKWCENHFYGVYLYEKLIGFAEWRHLGDTLFLNNIYIIPQEKGLGIGKLLFKQGLDFAKKNSISALCLDVFDWNIHARTWYENLGFQVMAETDWLVGKNPHSYNTDISQVFRLKDYPQAEATQLLYGFSAFKAQTKQSEYTIGRIKDSYFRLYDTSAIIDGDLLQGLYMNDPIRDILVLSPNDQAGTNSFLRIITSSSRMKLTINNKY